MNGYHLAAVALLAWSASAVEVRRNDEASRPTVHGDLVRAGCYPRFPRPAWRFTTGDRILSTASISEDGARVLFASGDMPLTCLNLQDGSLVWTSRQLPRLSVRDHFPVACCGLVSITTNPVKDFHTLLGRRQEMLARRTGFIGRDTRSISGTREEVAKEQQMIVEFLRAHPAEQTFDAFRAEDGQEPWIAPGLHTGGLHNLLTPPCYDPQTGEVFILFFIDKIRRQNIVGDTAAIFTANPVALTDTEVSECLARSPAIRPATADLEAQRIASKLARYCALVPEVGQALHRWSDGCGPARLKVFREEHNGWYLAFGGRLIGGENCTHPLHLPRSLFAGAAWVEAMGGSNLCRFVGMPWCTGDSSFIEKCVAALWAAAGRRWMQPP